MSKNRHSLNFFRLDSLMHEQKNKLPWLCGLNKSQKEAVSYLNGPLLVLSGAGTGKTKVLTSRIAQLIATNTAEPYKILAVTLQIKQQEK